MRSPVQAVVAVAVGLLVLAGCDLAGPRPPMPNVRATIDASARFPTPRPTSVAASDRRSPTLGLGTFSAFYEGIRVRVVRVVDGDTLEVQFEDGSSTTVDILGVTAPPTEVAIGDVMSTRCLADWGRRATGFMAEAVEGRVVSIVLDPQGFGRTPVLQVYVRLESGDLGAHLVTEGYARVAASTEIRLLAGYRRLEERAREQQVGLWSCEPPVTQPEGPPAPGPEFVASGLPVVFQCTRDRGRFVFRTTARVVPAEGPDPAGFAAGGHCVLIPE